MAWTTTSVRGYFSGTESITIADSAGANVVTANSTALSEREDLSNQAFTVYLTVTETSAGDGGLEVALQASPDGTNWVTIDTTTSMDLDTTGTNSAAEDLVATNVWAPYWRFQVITDGTDTQDACTVTLGYAAKRILL